jgi:4-hydroxy-3-methylbut-2-enyl diphosphate reductase IspH
VSSVSCDDGLLYFLLHCHDAERVGICGATSTPKWLMQQIKSRLETTNH